jgi:2-polyprenyl-3-methyl-5-hydroxy-6-metoxy-1,4-benzoquinol methylase
MAEAALTERQFRERQYYDEFVRRTSPDVASPAAIRGDERRPWNPYWYVAELLQQRFTCSTQQLLDFGCGPGSYSVQCAHIGYEVSGFDISPGNVETARALASRYGVGDRTHFAVGAAEQLDYPSSYFDVIVGIDILHHVDIRPAIQECRRVLKPGGVAIFKEPIEVPVFDRLRNTALGRALRPKAASFDRHITEDERKLTASDVRAIRELCEVDEHRFRLVSRLEALVSASGHAFLTKTGASRLEMFDRYLLRACRPLGVFGGNVVLVCRPPATGAGRHRAPCSSSPS